MDSQFWVFVVLILIGILSVGAYLWIRRSKESYSVDPSDKVLVIDDLDVPVEYYSSDIFANLSPAEVQALKQQVVDALLKPNAIETFSRLSPPEVQALKQRVESALLKPNAIEQFSSLSEMSPEEMQALKQKVVDLLRKRNAIEMFSNQRKSVERFTPQQLLMMTEDNLQMPIQTEGYASIDVPERFNLFDLSGNAQPVMGGYPGASTPIEFYTYMDVLKLLEADKGNVSKRSRGFHRAEDMNAVRRLMYEEGYAPMVEPYSSTNILPSVMAEDDKTFEPYVDYSGSGGRQEGCCGCDRLSSDLTNYCGGSGRSQCRYPIDLPAPEEPPVPSTCNMAGACGDSTCMNTLKYDLQ